MTDLFREYKTAAGTPPVRTATVDEALPPSAAQVLASQDAAVRRADRTYRSGLEKLCGDRWNGMTFDEQREYARKVLTPIMFELWVNNPQSLLAREDIFEAMRNER